MLYVIIICLLLLFLLCGAFAEVGMILAVSGVLCILFIAYVGIRAAIDPEYEKRIKREAEEEKRKKRRRSGPSRKQYDNFYRTGKIRYLYDEDYKGD